MTAVGGLRPRAAWNIVLVVLAGFVVIYGLAALGVAEPVPVRIAGALDVVVAIGLSRVRRRWAVWVQLVAGYLALLVFGLPASPLGFSVGSLLVRRYWVLAALVMASAVLVAGVSLTLLLVPLVVFGLTRMAERVEETAATRPALAMTAVAQERLRISGELTGTLGAGLTAIRGLRDPDAILATARAALAATRAAAADFRSLSLGPEATAARAILESAGIHAEVRVGHGEPLGAAGALLAEVLREAVTEVVRQGTATRCWISTEESGGRLVLRIRDDGPRTAEQGDDRLATLADRITAAGGTLRSGLVADGQYTVEAAVELTAPPSDPDLRRAYQPALLLLGIVLAGFSLSAVLQVPRAQMPVAAVTAATVCWLQFRWVRGPAQGRPKHWALALIVQAVLSYVPLLWWGSVWGGLATPIAGSALLAFRPVIAWPLVGLVMASMGLIAAALSQSVPVILNSTVSALVTGLLVYSLVRLAQLTDGLRVAGRELARASVVQERLRAARDLHDLLGHSLAVILLKCELARRLQSVDPGRAAAELAEVHAIAARAEADMATVTGAAPTLSLTAELAAARSVLAAAGIAVTITADPVDETVGGLLSVVLREAVTNMLRHSAAGEATVTLHAEDRAVRFTITNDGLDPAAPRTPPGAGIGNLTTRLAHHGGRLSARPDGTGRYCLEALVPAG